ncbi:MAG: phosphotransferase [Actinomycetes bacterium]
MNEGADVERLVRASPLFVGQTLTIHPLHGGITNRNFVVSTDATDYVVRIPGERTALLGIDRAHEAEAATRAADLGVGPPVLGMLDSVGTLVTQLVAGHHLELHPPEARLADVVGVIRRFHLSGPLSGAFPIHRIVEWHARDASAHGVMAPPAYERLHQQSRRIEAAFGRAPMPAVPCHNDLLPGNILFSEERVWLLDFEYAGMNDVFFDLGNLSINTELGQHAEERLLELYFGQLTKTSWARLQLMKMMSEFREGMWAVVQQAISSLDTDFVSYANERLASCERLASRPEFEGWLADAANPVD